MASFMGGDTLMKNTDSIAQEMVRMTNTPEGRTYIDYEWVIRDDLSDYRRAYSQFPGDFVQVATPHTVPNDKWVMERPYGWAWLIGITPNELERFNYTDKRGVRCTLLVSDKPFGYIVADEEDVDKSVYPPVIKQNGRKTLVYARQIHKGELGRGVRIPTLDYVRQPLAPHRGLGMSARERRRGQHGWVKLVDLGEMSVGYNPDAQIELVLGYWPFSGHRNYRGYQNDQEGGQLVDVAWGSRLDIAAGDAEFKSLTRKRFLEKCSFDTSDVWIRRGFAYTILRLETLGVQPEVSQLA